MSSTLINTPLACDRKKEIAVDNIAVVTARLIGTRLSVCACRTANVIEQIQGEREKELCYQPSRQPYC